MLIIYLMIFIFSMTFFISMMIMKISLLTSNKIKLNFEKMSPFECGFNPMNFKRISFSLRFFLISIIFLIFDIEIALMIPMIYSLKISNLMIWFYTSLMFSLILMIGLIHEWKLGALNWM